MFHRSKENQKKVKYKTVENDLYLIAHYASRFDSYLVLNNLANGEVLLN